MCFSHVQLSAVPWTVAHQSLLSIEFSKQEYWSGLPFLTPENLPDPRIEPKSLAPPSLVDRFLTTQRSGKPNKDDATTELVPTYILCTYIFSSTQLQAI